MSVCVGCLLSAATAAVLWTSGKTLEWRAERSRQKAMAEVDDGSPSPLGTALEARDAPACSESAAAAR